MTAPKRKPGRPRGSSRHEPKDRRCLAEVARLLDREPKMAKCRAIAQIVGKHFKEHEWQAAERRLLNKWNRSEKDRLAAAEEERRERHSQTLSSLSHYPPADTAITLAAALGYRPDIYGVAEAAQKALEASQRPWLGLDLNITEGTVAALYEGLASPTLMDALRRAEEQSQQMSAVEAMLPRLEGITGQLQSPAFQEAIERAQGVLGSSQVQRLLDQIDPLRRWGF